MTDELSNTSSVWRKDLEQLIVCAFRYSIERETCIDMIRILKEYWLELSPEYQNQIARHLQEKLKGAIHYKWETFYDWICKKSWVEGND